MARIGAVQNPQESDSFTTWLASAGLCVPSKRALAHSRGCWVKAMSHGTSCQHGTSLDTGKVLVPEQTSGVEERSCGGCHLVCEHGVWEKPKEVSSPVRQLLVKGIISNPENPPQESHGCQAQGRCESQ